MNFEKEVIGAVIDTNYRRLQGNRSIDISLGSIHNFVVENNIHKEFSNSIQTEKLSAIMADGTGFKRYRGEKGELRAIIGINKEGRVVPLGCFTNTSWDDIEKDIKKRLNNKQLSFPFIYDGEPGLDNFLADTANLHRCGWHAPRGLYHALWEDGVKKKKSNPHIDKIKEIVGIELPEEDFEIGDVFVEVIDPRIFGRRMVNTAKQFFSQRIQDVEKHYIYEDYSQRIGEIVIGVVHQVQRDNIFINIEQAELRMPKSEQIQSERYRRGDTVRTVVKSVEVTPRGPEIIVSRSDNHFLFKLFEMEVPEIDDGIIEILAIARHPGDRAKIIVKSQDRRIDPVGACVGMRGSRIQAIVRELNNEKIDIILSTSPPATVHIIGTILSYLTGKPFVIDYRDLWTQNESDRKSVV